MKYRVLWMPVAEQHLADLWINATDRNGVTAAADVIDALLQRDPLNAGESRLGATRVVFEGPIGCLFEVFPAERRVAVLDVWRCREM